MRPASPPLSLPPPQEPHKIPAVGSNHSSFQGALSHVPGAFRRRPDACAPAGVRGASCRRAAHGMGLGTGSLVGVGKVGPVALLPRPRSKGEPGGQIMVPGPPRSRRPCEPGGKRACTRWVEAAPMAAVHDLHFGVRPLGALGTSLYGGRVHPTQRPDGCSPSGWDLCPTLDASVCRAASHSYDLSPHASTPRGSFQRR